MFPTHHTICGAAADMTGLQRPYLSHHVMEVARD